MNDDKKSYPMEKKKKIIQDYNSSSPFYDKRYEKIQYDKYSLIVKEHSLSLNNKLILDAGCGTGLLFDYLKEYYRTISSIPFFSFIGVDISLQMLKRFYSKLLSHGSLSPNHFHLVVCDLENLPFRSKVFNMILSITSYQNLPNLKKGIEEAIQVARNKAIFIISILKKKLNQQRFEKILENYCAKIEYIANKANIEDLIIKAEINKE